MPDFLPAALLALLLAPSAGAQTLWRVDAGNAPGTDFTDIPPAVAAAAPGDVILVDVEDGVFYTAPVIDKALTLISDPEPTGGTVFIPSMIGQLVVENVSGAQPVRVVRFGVNGGAPDAPALVVRQCSSPVLLEGLSVFPTGPSAAAGLQRYAMEVRDSGPVVFGNGGVESFGGSVFNEPGYRGLLSVDSELYLLQCEIRGADGSNANVLGGSIGVVEPTPGQDGARIEGGRLFTSSALVRGGRGGDGAKSGGVCFPPGDGGDGLVLAGGAELVRFDSALQGGSPGNSLLDCPTSNAGSGLVAAGGTVQNLPGNGPTALAYRETWRTGDTATYRFFGEPGELVFALYSAGAQPLELPSLSGLLVPAAPKVLSVGAVSGSGSVQLSLTVPALPTAGDVAVLSIQGAHLDPATLQASLGPPSAAAWVATGL